MHTSRSAVAVVLAFLLTSCATSRAASSPPAPAAGEVADSGGSHGPLEVATFAEGCFWCTEAVFENVKGVVSVRSGYAGGHVDHPSYEQVCSGTTGHAEALEVKFDPKQISFHDLCEIFFATHDPTTLNRQGADVGTQYRSAIFYHNEAQHKTALAAKKEAQAEYHDPIVTEISPFTNFFAAEDYHQKYYDNNPYQGYCRMVISPKVAKFRKKFADKLKHS